MPQRILTALADLAAGRCGCRCSASRGWTPRDAFASRWSGDALRAALDLAA
jgi:hypothetical protein